MNAEQYRHALPSIAGYPFCQRTVGLRPLPIATLQRAGELERTIQQYTGSAEVGGLSARCFVLSECLCDPLPPFERLFSLDEVKRRFTVDEVRALFDAWSKVQQKSIPDSVELERELLRRMRTDGQLVVDGALAHDGSINQFYGLSVDRLTIGQLAYFLGLRSAYHRVYVDPAKGGTRAISKRFLESGDA